MDDKNSLLELWNLTETDLGAEKVLFNSFSEQDNVKTDDIQSLKFCDNCFASNCEDANWCIECGTAFIKSPVLNNPSLDIDQVNNGTLIHVQH